MSDDRRELWKGERTNCELEFRPKINKKVFLNIINQYGKRKKTEQRQENEMHKKMKRQEMRNWVENWYLRRYIN